MVRDTTSPRLARAMVAPTIKAAPGRVNLTAGYGLRMQPERAGPRHCCGGAGRPLCLARAEGLKYHENAMITSGRTSPVRVRDVLTAAMPGLTDRLLEERIRSAWPDVAGPLAR